MSHAALPNRPSQPRAGRQQRGVTLIEVMVAVLIFSFGLLGLVGLQARATQYSIGAEDANRAALLANDLAAAMWMQNSVELAEEVVEAWDARVADPTTGGLPNGSGTVAVDAGVATITVSWTPVGGGVAHRYQTQVMLP